jgi:sugar (pentulose or hexulose) kinase
MSYAEILEKADAIMPGAEGLLALPYFSGAGSPRWDPHAYGGFYGLTLAHTGIHILRSLLESIAYEIRLNIEIMQKGGASIEKIRLSGGASQNMVLCQIISDVLQIPVEIFEEAEASSWGLFCLVKNSLEPSGSLEEIHGTLGLHITRLEPQSDLKDAYDGIYKKYIKLGDLLHSFAT